MAYTMKGKVMKKMMLTGLFIFTAVFSFGQVIDRTVAKVRLTKTEVVTERLLRQQIELLETQVTRSLQPEDKERMLNLQIGELLINQAAARDGVRVSDAELSESVARYKQQIAPQASDPQFRVVIQNQFNMTWDAFLSTMRQRLIQEKYVTEKKRSYFAAIEDPTEIQIQQVYDANATDFTNPQLIRFNQVFIDTRNLSDTEKQQAKKRAEDAVAELRTSQFKDVVLKYSDDTSSKYRGGDAGYLPRNDSQRQAILGRTFFESLFAMTVNQTSGVLQSNIGFHIVQISEKRDPKLLGLNDPIFPGASVTVKKRITDMIAAQNHQAAFQRSLNEVIEELKKEAEITYYDEKGKELAVYDRSGKKRPEVATLFPWW
jgi:parvulin-like peptidyl-prolyl isomerase